MVVQETRPSSSSPELAALTILKPIALRKKLDKGTIFSCHMMQSSWERAWQQTLELQLPGSLGFCTTCCNSWSDHCRTTALFARILSPPYWLSIENLQLQEEEEATPAQLAQTSLLFNSRWHSLSCS